MCYMAGSGTMIAVMHVVLSLLFILLHFLILLNRPFIIRSSASFDNFREAKFIGSAP